MQERFTIRIDRADRDEFTIYPWGEIRNDEVVKTYDDGEKRFGPLDEQLERVEPTVGRPAPTERWLEDNRSVGTMAQRPRARANHPLVSRSLGYREYQCIAALRGLDEATVPVESLTELQATNDGRLRVRYVLPTALPDAEAATEETFASVVAALMTQPRPRYGERVLCDEIAIRAYRYEREIGRLDVDGTDLYGGNEAVDFDQVQAIAEDCHVDDVAE